MGKQVRGRQLHGNYELPTAALVRRETQAEAETQTERARARASASASASDSESESVARSARAGGQTQLDSVILCDLAQILVHFAQWQELVSVHLARWQESGVEFTDKRAIFV